MQILIDVSDKAGSFAQGLGKFVADVKRITGPGAGSTGEQTAELLSAAVQDLIPAFKDFDEVSKALKDQPLDFAVALQACLLQALAK